MIVYLQLAACKGKTLLIIADAADTVARIKALAYHTLAAEDVHAEAFRVYYKGKSLPEFLTLEDCGLSNTRDHVVELVPVQSLAQAPLQSLSFADNEHAAKLLQQEMHWFSRRARLLHAYRILLFFCIFTSLASLVSFLWYIPMISVLVAGIELVNVPQFSDLGGFTVQMLQSSIAHMDRAKYFNFLWAIAIAAMIALLGLDFGDDCDIVCEEDTYLTLGTYGLLALLFLGTSIVSWWSSFNFRRRAGDLLEPYLLSITNINSRYFAPPGTSRRTPLPTIDELSSRDTLAFVQRIHAFLNESASNCLLLCQLQSVIRLLEVAGGTGQASELAILCLERMLRYLSTHPTLLEHGVVERIQSHLASNPIQAEQPGLTCLVHLCATDQACQHVLKAGTLESLRDIAKGLLPKSNNSLATITSALMRANHYEATSEDVEDCVFLVRCVLQSAPNGDCYNALACLNDLLELHLDEINDATLGRLIISWQALVETSDVEVAILAAQACASFCHHEHGLQVMMQYQMLDSMVSLLRPFLSVDEGMLVAQPFYACVRRLDMEGGLDLDEGAQASLTALRSMIAERLEVADLEGEDMDVMDTSS
ncbi:uncharacterized protein MONBRDRAFT_27494 [Monosiga brevicollis MX1]|uniref:Ubiquitin-like domain-containing protein n=1 Tax=Monosiga brevicollis TaxID=81824 RepID=A9V5F6_MONBE|nr:uncharacterized protein MONBRDRAFT_27494 [Monosiga brevicollis MX1]EDQ87274.1 predicted protein [Monosiga brevicollis MX1]|eukprot:XP_001747887.1 hypothetical protein [Monosiga brevicollis MX1]